MRILIDISDVLAFATENPNASGVQRVACAAIRALREGGWRSGAEPFDGAGGARIHVTRYCPERQAFFALRFGDDQPGRDPYALIRASARRGENNPFAVELQGGGVEESERLTLGSEDVIVNFGTYTHLPGLLTVIAAQRAQFGCRFVSFVHDLLPVTHPEFFGDTQVDGLQFRLRQQISVSDVLLVNSQATRAALAEVAPAATIAVFPLDFVTLPPSGRAKRDLPEAVRRSNYILALGTLEARKRYDLVLESFAGLQATTRERRPRPQLVIVGRLGDIGDEIMRRIEASSAAPHILLLQNVDDDALALLLEHARCLIYLSETEGWGLPISEAHARGVPAVYWRASAMAEAGQGLGRPCPPGDLGAVVRALTLCCYEEDGRAALTEELRSTVHPIAGAEVAGRLTKALEALAPMNGALRAPDAAFDEKGEIKGLGLESVLLAGQFSGVEPWGAWLLRSRSRLLNLPSDAKLRLHLRAGPRPVLGSVSSACDISAFQLDPEESSEVVAETSADGELELEVDGLVDFREYSDGRDTRRIAVGIEKIVAID